MMVTLHVHIKALFQELALAKIQEWDTIPYFPSYLKGEIFPEDSLYRRMAFWNRYNTATKQVWFWLESLPPREKEMYRRFTFPVVPPMVVAGLVKHAEVKQHQHQVRKIETDALVPHFAALRSEAHLRFNRMVRLRQAYYEALKKSIPGGSAFPLDFSYIEGEPGQESLRFRIWDRRSFILAHAEHYSRATVQNATAHVKSCTAERDRPFLEFLGATRLSDGEAVDGLWFAELLRQGVLGDAMRGGPEEELQRKRRWLIAWGYQDEESPTVAPFRSATPGLLCWSHLDGDAKFMHHAQAHTEGWVLPVESLYAAAHFGLLAVDLFTTTGMRINELLQIRLSKDCLMRVVDDPPPGAKDRSPRIRYLFRLIPKGERTNTPRNYFLGKETLRMVEKVGQMLKEHYRLMGQASLPHVAFAPQNGRAHRFDKGAYLFQYHQHHMDGESIAACMRFLVHGMVFRSREGKQVVLKPHLLRHTFATYAVQVEHIPVDVVAEWLKQKDLEVTRYYSQVTESMIAEEHGTFVARIALQINVREAILRSPTEIQQQIEQAKRTVGTLIPVIGGDCTLDARCPAQFMCIGCSAKAPDPAKRSQIEQLKQRAQDKLVYCEQEGLVLEAERMKHAIRNCETELQEMIAIEDYRKDEKIVPLITINPQL